MTKRILLTSVALVAGLASNALAGAPATSGLKVTLGGMVDSAVGHVKNATKFKRH